MAKKDKKKDKKDKHKDRLDDELVVKEHKEHKESKSESADHSEEIKRLNRVIGQVEGIKKMLESDRGLDDVLIQCKAVHSALKAVESRLLMNYLDVAIAEISKAEKKKTKEQKISELMDLYKPV